jgi:disulfide bond formation protein DsbB
MVKPSFLAQILNAAFLMAAIYVFAVSYQQLSNSNIIIILLLMSLAFGIHGLMHAVDEIYYGYNPLEGKWSMDEKDKDK